MKTDIPMIIQLIKPSIPTFVYDVTSHTCPMTMFPTLVSLYIIGYVLKAHLYNFINPWSGKTHGT